MMIGIIDYGMGNVGSISNMLRKIGVETLISSDAKVLTNAEKLILPGVGSIDQGMNNLSTLGLVEVLQTLVFEKNKPILGICLGMQMLTEFSEEGSKPGLGFIKANTLRFQNLPEGCAIPHMGWNSVRLIKHNVLFNGLGQDSRFYFAHSYYISCNNLGDVLATTHYGLDFCSAFQSGNVFGVQFHPEKSHKFGMTLLKNYTEL